MSVPGSPVSGEPKVSIGMPVYNGSKWLAATVDSVLAQSFRDIELVISDNASTDDTEAMCRAYAARDPRVRYHRNAENVGIANNFNLAFTHARGRYFKWMSCGDLIDPGFVARCVDLLDRRPEVALAYPVTRLFSDDPARGEDARDAFNLDVDDPVERFQDYTCHVRLNNIMHGMYRRDVLARTRLYRSFLRADYNMIAAVLLQGRAVCIDEVLNFRRMQPETTTKGLTELQLRTVYAPSRPSSLKYQEWRRVRDYYAMVLRSGLSVGQRLQLLVFVTKNAFWQRDDLLKELRGGGWAA